MSAETPASAPKRRCTGGPCPHCPDFDHVAVREYVANIAELLKYAPDDDTRAALAQMATRGAPKCAVCKNKGHVRVCSATDGGCDGRGHRLVIRKELTHAVVTHADGSTSMVEEMRDVEFNGEKCTRCNGCGHEAIDASQVGVE